MINNMIEHWYEYLPAAWFTPEGRWYVAMGVSLVFFIGFAMGFIFHIFKTNYWLIKHGYKPSEFFKEEK